MADALKPQQNHQAAADAAMEGEEESKVEEYMAPVREAHVAGDPYKFDMYLMIKMGQGYVSQWWLHKKTEEFKIVKCDINFGRLFPSVYQ